MKGGTITMNDKEIVKLFFDRDEAAIKAADEQYKSYLIKIAQNITGSREDAEECVNDALLKAWESIPPQSPELLSAYLGKLTRNLAINRRKLLLTEKRGGGEAESSFEELSKIIKSGENVEQELDRRELAAEISAFLNELPELKQKMFVRRYWYCESVKTIAAEMCLSETHVSVTLHRVREKLRIHLRKRGYNL